MCGCEPLRTQVSALAYAEDSFILVLPPRMSARGCWCRLHVDPALHANLRSLRSGWWTGPYRSVTRRFIERYRPRTRRSSGCTC